MSEKDVTFESELKKLEETYELLRNPDIALEDAISAYETGVKHYKKCKEVLEKANQKIETLSK